MKHDNVIKYDAIIWTWFKFALCDDALFITSCINNAFGNEILQLKKGCPWVYIS